MTANTLKILMVFILIIYIAWKTKNKYCFAFVPIYLYTWIAAINFNFIASLIVTEDALMDVIIILFITLAPAAIFTIFIAHLYEAKKIMLPDLSILFEKSLDNIIFWITYIVIAISTSALWKL